MPNKSIRFFNPPSAITPKVSKEGVDIGGSLSIIAMDRDHNLHIVENILSELSWGEFSKEKGMRDQIESITPGSLPGDDDATTLTSPEELVKRIINALTIIEANNLILFGIGDFECNSFMASVIDIDSKYVERLMDEQKRLRNRVAFPVLMDNDDINKTYIEVKFTGNARSYFHFNQKFNLNSIFKRFQGISGYANGIICNNSNGIATFYILNENIHNIKEKKIYRLDTKNLEGAFTQMKLNKAFPISWFRIGLGLASIKALEQWPEIRKNSKLKKALVKYFKYAKKGFKKIDDTDESFGNKRRKRKLDSPVDINSRDLDSLREILGKDDLGMFSGKKRRR